MCSVYYLVLDCIQIEELHEWKKGKEEEKEKEQMDEDIPDQFVIYKQILELLRPGETVVKVTWLTVCVCVCCSKTIICTGNETSRRKWGSVSSTVEEAEGNISKRRKG